MTNAEMVAELQRRITNLSSTVAQAALNRALSWVMRQASFQFMITGPLTLTVTGAADPNDPTASANLSGSLDPGKAKMMLNIDGTPIQHVPFSEFWTSSNYNVTSMTGLYDTYTIRTDNYASPTHSFYFMPKSNGTAIFFYHRVPNVIDNSTGTCDLPVDFHPLLIDLAEADERRIYDVGDSWQLLMARSQDQLKLLIDGYRSMTSQPSQLSDAQVKIQEQTQLGKA